MTTTISPGLGHAPAFTQQGTGTTPGYDAIDFRRAAYGDPSQEGVFAAGDWMVTQRGAGANLSVDIANSGPAWVQGDSVTLQGLYAIPPHSATINEVITTANATNPRIDRVILEIQDNVHDASGGNLARTRVLTGTATAGATLDNLTGAVAVPVNALLLADILVGAGVVSITNANIRDRRPWARGAFYQVIGSNGGNHSSASATYAELTIYTKRVECSGVPLRVTFVGTVDVASSVPSKIGIQLDSTAPTTGQQEISTSGTGGVSIVTEAVLTPSAGSHLVKVMFASPSGPTAIIDNSAGIVPVLTVEEIVRQNTANNATTTG